MPVIHLLSRTNLAEVQYVQSYPILYLQTEKPITYPMGKHGLAFTFIALSSLSSINGFPALGKLNWATFHLESSQALHCLADLEQCFDTGGSSVAVVIAWKINQGRLST